MPPFTISRAAAHEWLPACRILFNDRAEQGRELLVTDPDDAALFVARDSDNKLRAAALVQAIPGAMGLAWPTRGDSRGAEGAVARAACEWLRTRGVKVCQAFASANEIAEMVSLERCGFRRSTQLKLLQRDLRSNLETITSPQRRFLLVAEGPPFTEEFERTLLATHEDTQDCPELNATRTPAEILAGFSFRRGSKWYLVECDREPAGVILLEVDPVLGVSELTYIGLIPAFRRRGFGAELLNFAIGFATLSSAHIMNVSVDVRNVPAMKLYARHRFVEYDCREVWLAQFHEPDA